MKVNMRAVLFTVLFVCVESFILQDDEIQPAVSSPLEGGDTFPEVKRGRLSLTADLRSLARMLEAHRKRFVASRSPYDSIRKKLFAFGKRNSLSQRQMYSDDHSDDVNELPILNARVSEELPISNVKRQRLSVNGALSSLADMLAASGRQRMMSEMAMNRQRLFGLGK